MAFGMFSAQTSPIAIDFGSSSVKLLQIAPGPRPALVAAAEIPLPDSVRSEPERIQNFLAEWLPKTFRDGSFKGKRVTIAIPSAQTLIQHMQVSETEGVTRDDAVKSQLQMQMGVAPSNVVVRTVEVCPVHRGEHIRTEMICLAIAKDTVMRYVDLIRKCKLEVVGVHTEMLAMLGAFDNINRRIEDDRTTTLYVDLGWGGTRVAIAHGKQLVFARSINIGGRSFDQTIAAALKCDLAAARNRRLEVENIPAAPPRTAGAASETGAKAHAAAATSGGSSRRAGGQSKGATAVEDDRRTGDKLSPLTRPLAQGVTTRTLAGVDVGELLDTVADEIAMCLRYHNGLFRGRRIDRAMFIGGESRQGWLCQHVIGVLGVSALMGDPISQIEISPGATPLNLDFNQPQPGWAVACGLCTASTDL